jgi:hypothetical protein
MGLRGSVYYYYSLKNKKDKNPFFIFIKNNINLGNIPSSLFKLFEIKEEIIAYCYI